MKNKLLWPQRLPPISPCGPLCHRKTQRARSTRTEPNTRSDRAPGNVSGAARTSGAAATWADAKTEPHKQRNRKVLWSTPAVMEITGSLSEKN